MIRNDAEDFAQRLYARVPSNYRVYDAEQGLPLLALLRVVGEQAANLRQDLDALWDNFFIETCQDWAVPYIGALVGTNLLANPIGRGNRLEVRDTVVWRRSKGTPAMLRALANEISGWPTDFTEFFHSLGWAQNLNHVRLDRQLTADLRDPSRLSLLGHADDPFAHAANFDPARDLDQPRITSRSLGIGRAAWGTPGRHQIKNLGLFVRRLRVFPVRGATPAAVDPGAALPPGASCFTFDPLHRDVPLFDSETAAPLSRDVPVDYFGTDVGVRQWGVLLAQSPATLPSFTSSRTAFTFGGSPAPFSLNATNGLELLNAREFQLAGRQFTITALWDQGNPSPIQLGQLSTLHAALRDGQAFTPGAAAGSSGKLSITVETGAAARFPGAVVAVRSARTGAPHLSDAVLVYLPPALVTPSNKLTYWIADDGSTYTAADLNASSLARASEGSVYPAVNLTASAVPASDFALIHRKPGALRIADPSRFTGISAYFEAQLFTGAYQAQGGIATTVQAASAFSQLDIPDPWPAFTFGPSRAALDDDLPSSGLLTIQIRPLAGNFVPASEMIVTNREGESLLVYLPEIENAPATGRRVFVADDGSTYLAPDDLQQQPDLLDGLQLARAAAGQTLSIPGTWPIQMRVPVSMNLCDCRRAALLNPGELGIDPELGRFAFAPGDPSVGLGGLSVDYVEAFADRVGAMTYDRLIDPAQRSTRWVSRTGEGAATHTSVADAVAAAVDGDVIEIRDSATYPLTAPIILSNAAVKRLTIRAAAGQRPCLTWYSGPNTPTAASFDVRVVMDSFELSGLLISGGPVVIGNKIAQLRFTASTFDPRNGDTFLANDADMNHPAAYLLCRCVSGGIRAGAGVTRLTIADSIVDRRGGFAIATAPSVQLERVTVLGRIHCDVLNASESILDDFAVAEDQQAGCIRFSRYEVGSQLPKRYQCVPSEDQATGCKAGRRCYAPLFNSRRFGRPDYVQLAAACPPEILTASEQHSEIGAFTGAFNTIRLANLRTKLQEFMPVGLAAVIIAET